MNGADALLGTLTANGVDVCFANPGTSEMHFVAALDGAPAMRGVLCLFEGVVTGAADGYGRVTGRPAATLLHLGPGLGNGIANLHNARRAHSPVLNIVGDHATYHARFDAPLQSDIESLARPVSGWFRRTARADDVAGDTADAVRAAYGPPGAVATLALPADASWSPLSAAPPAWPIVVRPRPPRVAEGEIAEAARLLRGTKAAILVGGDGLGAEELRLAARLAQATGAKLFGELFARNQAHGRGVPSPERLIYLTEFAVRQLAEFDVLLLFGAVEPVSFFAYPNVPSRIVGEGCTVHSVVPPGADVADALRELVEVFRAAPVAAPTGERPERPSGPCTPATTAAAIGATLPEDVIVVDEGATGGIHLMGATQFAPPHEWLTLTGGAIGYGLPAALGAAVGGGGRRVLCVEADGSMMYTPQALWSMAREGLDVTIVALSNRSYAILNYELQRVGAQGGGPKAQRMLDLDEPELRLAELARSLGVPAERVTTAEELTAALEKSFVTPGPSFVEVMHGKGFG